MVLSVRSAIINASVYHYHRTEDALAIPIKELMAGCIIAQWDVCPDWQNICGLMDIGYLHEPFY
jgi:hypothetical protein